MRTRFVFATPVVLIAVSLVGCRGKQHAHVLTTDDVDMVGSHTAGAETWKPLVDVAVSQLLAVSLYPRTVGHALSLQYLERVAELVC